MTLVAFQNVAGQARGESLVLPGRRRRLSTIVRRHAPAGRRVIASVHRRGEPLVLTDPSVRYRTKEVARRERGRTWCETLVGPNDAVLITILPMGGRSSSGGGRGGKAGIGLSLAAIALMVVAPYAAPAIATAIGVSTFAVQAGLVIGGVALAYAAQRAGAAKKEITAKSAETYGVSGGGNVARPNERKPWLYGRSWSTPPLSQRDVFFYAGADTVLIKRMTLGIGKFQVHRIRVGEAIFWTETGGIQAPFNVDLDPTSGAAVEILYEQASHIAPGDYIGSSSVSGQQLPRAALSYTPWYRLTPYGQTAGRVLLNYSWPQILNTTSSKPLPAYGDLVFEAQRLDETTGAPSGPVIRIHRDLRNVYSQTVVHGSATIDLPADTAWQIRGTNAIPKTDDAQNDANWDLMAAIKADPRIRLRTTEIVIRIRSGAGLAVTDYGDVEVDATAIIPVWTGTGFVEQATRKCVHAYVDMIRAEHGLDDPDGAHLAKALATAARTDLGGHDTYDGQLPQVSSWWEAAAEVLAPLRAEPVKLGAIHSFVRDESADEPRHVLSRRQIVRNSGQGIYKLAVSDGGADVIVEFDWDGDPRRPDEVRYSVGPRTRTPKRYKFKGVSSGSHALMLATWLAAVACYRGHERKIATEWDGRLVLPGDHILSDMWFLRGTAAYGVLGRTGNVLALDVDHDVPGGDWTYGSIRNRVGREWGGVLRVRGAGPRAIELDTDDVAALVAASGKPLDDVLARDTQDPTTIVVGALEEIQRTYIARSAVPSDEHHVDIEMVRDDPRVWQLLGETVVVPLPPATTDNLAAPLTPTIVALHARCQTIETGIELAWYVTPPRGAVGYDVQLSYDNGGHWEPVDNGGGVLASGRQAMRQSTQPVTLRARAIGRTGLAGAWKDTTFTTVAPVIDRASLPAIALDQVDAAFEQFLNDVDGRSQEARTISSEALGAVTVVKQAYEDPETGLAAIIERIDGLDTHGSVGWVVAQGPSGALIAYRLKMVAEDILAGLTVYAKSDGSSGIVLDAGTFMLRDPNAGGGEPLQLLTYQDGKFRFFAPVQVDNKDLAPGATADFSRNQVNATQEVGVATGNFSNQVYSGISSTFVTTGQECMLDITTDFTVGVDAAFGYPVTFVGDIYVDNILCYRAFEFNGNVNVTGAVAFSRTQKVFFIAGLGTKLDAGAHTISLRISYAGAAPGSRARIYGGSKWGFILHKRTGG